MKVGLIPFGNDLNPYQELTRRAIAAQGAEPLPIPKSNFFPLARAAFGRADVLHFDWLHSFYRGKNPARQWIKDAMYRVQVPALSRKPIVWTVHNLQTHNVDDNEFAQINAFVEKVDALVSMTKVGVPLIRECWPAARDKRIEVVPHGHYIDWYTEKTDREAEREKLGLAGARSVGLFFGRVQPYKGVLELVDAFKKTAGEADHLIIAGLPTPAELGAAIEEKVRGDDRFTCLFRFLDKEEVAPLFSAADYAVMPFRQIFNSGSVLLALSFGLPVVAPKLGCLPEVVPEEAFFSYDPDRKNELKKALAAVMGTAGLGEVGRRAKSVVAEKHSWGLVGGKLVSLYADLVP